SSWTDGLPGRLRGCPHAVSVVKELSPPTPPPPSLPRWSAGLCTTHGYPSNPAPAGLVPVERGLVRDRTSEVPCLCSAQAQAPPRQARWGPGSRETALG